MTHEQQTALATFARRAIRAGCWEGVDVEGGTLQNWAEELGLIVRSETEYGDLIYLLADWLKETPT